MVKKVVPSQVVDLIEDRLPNISQLEKFKTNAEYAPLFRAVDILADDIPDELIDLGGADYTAYVLAINTLLHQVDQWNHRGAGGAPGALNGKHPLRVIWELLKKCPDSRPSPATAGLEFIKDPDLRESIRLDLSSAWQSLHNSEWKPATVMAGAVTEALLLWSVQEDLMRTGATTPAGLLDWGLAQLANEAGQRGIIKAPTKSQIDLMRDFRNLIHPGRAQRIGQACTRATALAALAAAEMVTEDLK